MSKRDEYISLAFKFQEYEGRLPVRIDWRAENLAYFRKKHKLKYPAERQVQVQFGSWGHFLVACGGIPKSTQKVADIAVEHVVKRYGAIVMPGASGTIDAHINDESVEIKGATLVTDDLIRTPRWRFRLHSRQYSLLVDKVILVGLSGEEPVVEWMFDRVDMAQHLDGKDALSIRAKDPFGTSYYPFYFLETWKASLAYQEVVDKQGLHNEHT